MTHKIIAIIPARGGSKGILKKNIRMLAGKPLIQYTINAAQGSKYLDDIIVSTDDDEIAQVAKSQCVTIIKRPLEISSDDSPTMDAILHTLEQCEIKKLHSNIIVLLQPTSPLRTSSDIDTALELFMHNECDSVISVIEANHPPYWNMVLEGSYLQPIFDDKLFRMRRQDLPKTYLPNGAIYIAFAKTLKKNLSFNCQRIKPFIMTTENSIDIDCEFDFFLAETLMKLRIDYN